LAVKLKEKGFRKPCIAHYCCLDGNVLKFNITTNCIRGSNVKCLNGENNIYTDAPTISQVLKWLRKEKKMHMEIFLYDRKYSYFVKSITQICEDDLFHKCLNDDTTDEEYVTYEQAALAGIEYVLYNLI
jgi:hypothetical protein